MEDPFIDPVRIAPVDLLRRSASMLGDQHWLFVAIVLAGMVISSIVPLGILKGPMMCGMYLCVFNRMRGKKVSFEGLFEGFDFFLESLIATFLMALVPFIVILPMAALILGSIIAAAVSGQASPIWIFPLSIGAGIVSVVLTTLVSTLFLFTYPLICDRQMSALAAIRESCVMALAHFMPLLVTVIVFGIAAVLASLPCGIGTIFLAPVFLGAVGLLYEDLFGGPREDPGRQNKLG